MPEHPEKRFVSLMTIGGACANAVREVAVTSNFQVLRGGSSPGGAGVPSRGERPRAYLHDTRRRRRHSELVIRTNILIKFGGLRAQVAICGMG